MRAMTKAKVSLGQVVATAGAVEAMRESGQTPGFFLMRHAAGDWGEVDADDWSLNDRAVIDGTRLLSAYRTLKGERLWIITEADRSVTSILRPDEY
jgi:hypothetical protein